MSLYGTGRKEGIVAVLLIGLLTTATHLGSRLHHGHHATTEILTVIACAIGGMLCYRLIRVQGRSRYAAFLTGLAYGLSPWFAGLACAPRELLATALAPLALEAVYQCSRPSSQRRWLPFAGLCVALPFAFGLTMVACCSAFISALVLIHTLFHSDHSEERAPVRQLATSFAITIAVAGNLLWLDALSPWLGEAQAPTPWQVLSGDPSTPSVLHATTMLRAISPFAVWFALLGVLRRQRHVMTIKWLVLAAAGLLPTVLLALAPQTMSHTPALPAGAWFATVLATLVLAAAGLDDFLDQPTRRKTGQYLLLATTLVLAPLLPVFDASDDASRHYVVFATLVIVALSTLTWHRLGILRFKNVLTTLAVAAFALPVVMLDLAATPQWGAVPLGEMATASLASWSHLTDRPAWHFAGLALAALLQVVLICTSRAKR